VLKASAMSVAFVVLVLALCAFIFRSFTSAARLESFRKIQGDDSPARPTQPQFMIETDSLPYWRANNAAWLHEDLFIVGELNPCLYIRLVDMHDSEPTLS
jgi:hypothetical protein